MLRIINESLAEFKKVTWPSRKETIRLTAYVIGVSLFVGLVVTGIDEGFNYLLKAFL